MDSPEPSPDRPSWWRAGIAGLLAAGTALAIGELIAGLSDRLAAPVISVGNQVVDAVPRPVKDLAIEQFGTNDKKALLVGIYAVAAVLGVVFGIVASRRFVVGAAGIAVFGAVGVWAATDEVGAPWWAGLPSVIGAVAGVAVLAALLATVPHAHVPAHLPGQASLARRSFLQLSVGVVVVAAGAAATGRWLQDRFSAAASRVAVTLPRPRRRAPELASDVRVDVDGVTPFLTPNDRFYRIDTNLTVPQIPTEGWSLRIHGRVDEEMELSYADVLDLPMVERRITLACVSNEIGGGLVGTATWLGTPLEALLDRAGIQPEADQVVGRAFDGFTTGWPVANLRDGREPLLVVGMNGEPLPLAHGFPARLLVPGLYGYVSATKWLTEIELARFDDFDPYWIRRGWARKGPIKTATRIDTPRGLQKVQPGKVPIAGVAWAPTRGIEAVEVRVDGGPWRRARMAAADSDVTWRQWVHEWEATEGRHTIEARAIDGEGDVQTGDRADPFPSGATGWHQIVVRGEAA